MITDLRAMCSVFCLVSVKHKKYSVGIDVLTAVVMKICVLWHIMPCKSVERQSTFRRNIPPPPSGSKSKPNKKPA
jgi:hypothetical protein